LRWDRRWVEQKDGGSGCLARRLGVRALSDRIWHSCAPGVAEFSGRASTTMMGLSWQPPHGDDSFFGFGSDCWGRGLLYHSGEQGG